MLLTSGLLQSWLAYCYNHLIDLNQRIMFWLIK